MGFEQLLIASINRLKLSELSLLKMLTSYELKMVNQIQSKSKKSYTAINSLS